MSELRSAPGPGDPVTPVEQRPWPGLDVAGLTILVAGFGVSGYAVADQTMQRGTVTDASSTSSLMWTTLSLPRLQ